MYAHLQRLFGEQVQQNQPLARYTSARVGGAAEILLTVHNAEELAQAVQLLWQADAPFIVLGGGSNVLICDDGLAGVTILNRARAIRIDANTPEPSVWAESGTNFGLLARQLAAQGLGGIQWAAGIPGTLGGAIVGNAGAHGGDMAHDLISAQVLLRSGELVEMSNARLQFSYRSSWFKQHPNQAVILAATLRLRRESPADIQAQMDEWVAYRKRTQPPGASTGSMFKNPPGNYAGRLIEAAGLKGLCSGEAQISPIHANFFVNLGNATAADFATLIRTARAAVQQQFGITLELEVGLLGDWSDML
ncbi:MAG: UDP-N-acetylmuramate dehydrogenase [Anaerolineales bacterium]